MRFSSAPLQRAVASAALSALLVVTPMPAPAEVTLEQAATEIAEATYPFLQAQTAEVWAPFENKLVDILLAGKPSELANTFNLGIDVVLSLPPAKLNALNDVVVAAAATAKPSGGCASTVPSPAPKEIVAKLKNSEAIAATDPERIKALASAAGPALKAVGDVASGATICLPPVEQLSKLSLLQVDILKSVDLSKAKDFDKASKVAAKTIPVSQLTSLLPDARKLPGIRTAASGDELKQQKRLKAAVPVLEDMIKKILKERVRFGE